MPLIFLTSLSCYVCRRSCIKLGLLSHIVTIQHPSFTTCASPPATSVTDRCQHLTCLFTNSVQDFSRLTFVAILSSVGPVLIALSHLASILFQASEKCVAHDLAPISLSVEL